MFEQFYIEWEGLPWAIFCIALATVLVNGLAAQHHREGETASWGGILVVFGLILVIGLRPLDGLYVDMMTYAKIYQSFISGYRSSFFSDVVFDHYMRLSSRLVAVETFFLVTAALYVIPLVIATRRLFGGRWPFAVAIMASSFSFYGYGVNGLRNGVATSILLLSLTSTGMRQKIFWALVALGTHFSTALTLLAHAVALRLKSVRPALAFWFVSILLSILIPNAVVGGFVESLGDSRSRYFTSDLVTQTGMRWDFILYSASGVAAVMFWKYVRKIEDRAFDVFANTYIIANGGWILVNDVAFSNRFAYLSWFLLELTILFPLLRHKEQAEYLVFAGVVLLIANRLLMMVLI